MFVILHPGVSVSGQYQCFSDELNYTEAHEACQRNHFEYLARIDKSDNLSMAKNSSSYNETKKYWTGLQM